MFLRVLSIPASAAARGEGLLRYVRLLEHNAWWMVVVDRVTGFSLCAMSAASSPPRQQYCSVVMRGQSTHPTPRPPVPTRRCAGLLVMREDGKLPTNSRSPPVLLRRCREALSLIGGRDNVHYVTGRMSCITFALHHARHRATGHLRRSTLALTALTHTLALRPSFVENMLQWHSSANAPRPYRHGGARVLPKTFERLHVHQTSAHCRRVAMMLHVIAANSLDPRLSTSERPGAVQPLKHVLTSRHDTNTRRQVRHTAVGRRDCDARDHWSVYAPAQRRGTATRYIADECECHRDVDDQKHAYPCNAVAMTDRTDTSCEQVRHAFGVKCVSPIPAPRKQLRNMPAMIWHRIAHHGTSAV
ncbi:hypothetical protein CERZMDRAFT_83751 [Cercospora zeae-maydis SCOH1-5]|uniref:Uncharacterized protein n=1 Tax=Cercospora zeae-maydis SCOH1-5 TaxID=717836 RepID=A0A6A6FJQ7_9PEZI|nr:hypothetical protein CERZMDRAFT_83751 [Cercospora zeae-maydis SCOH1-5]